MPEARREGLTETLDGDGDDGIESCQGIKLD